MSVDEDLGASEAPPGDATPDEDAIAAEEAEAQGLRDIRLAKVAALRERGVDPYPARTRRDTQIGELRTRFGDLEAGAETDVEVAVAGRVMLVRDHGRLVFVQLRDRSGEIQLFVSKKVLGAERFDELTEVVDRGDWLAAQGTVMVSKRGELSVMVTDWQLLSKAIRPLPDKWRGLADTDTRYRQRYVDLVTNPETRRTFDVRFAAVNAIRSHLLEQGYLEVETPALSLIQGGATARPFTTHYNALDTDTYLRIALELPLKRLIVGGLERVFELGRVFRNEGIDTRHNPEFTMLEAYAAFADYHDMMALTEALVVRAAREALGTTVITVSGREVDLAEPWRRAPMIELIAEHAGVQMHPAMPVEEARAILDRFGLAYQPDWGSGRLLATVYDEVVEQHLVEPTFVLDHPREVSPLAKAKADDPLLVERFELVVDGRELANAYSELNDPIDQLDRFEEEAKAKAGGDVEAGDVDYDYIRALEFGLPPTGGLGIGIDRLVMLLSGQTSIREVILFPTLRPEEGGGGLAEAPELADVAAPSRHAERRSEPLRWRGSPYGRAPVRLRLASWLVAATGVLYLLAVLPVLSYEFADINDSLLPEVFRSAGNAFTTLIGASLLYLARQVRRRKRRAWVITTLLFAVAIIVNVLKDQGAGGIALTLDDTPEIFSIVVLVLLIWCRKDCRAEADPPSWSQLVVFVPTYLAIVSAYGLVALYTQHDRLSPSTVTFGGALETVFWGLIGVSGPYEYSNDVFGYAFPASLLVFGIVGIVIAGVLAFRPVVSQPKRSASDNEHARRLVQTYGWDTLAAFDLRPDKSFFFSSDGEAMIAYAYLGRTALVSADPVGAEDSLDLVVDEFLEFTEQRGWDVAFLAVREADLDRYHARGLHSLYLGDEAIVHCERFSLDGPAMRSVRQAVSRVARDHSFELLHESQADATLVAELNEISHRWRAGSDERGFTMTLGEEVAGDDPEFLLAVARRTDTGTVVGFLRLVPAYGDDPGYTLDLMRHDLDAPNGLVEYLTAMTATELRARGAHRLSMNFAAWGRLWQQDVELTPGLRLLRWFVRKLNPYFQIKSLYDFNEKFDPEWLPRSIVVTSPMAVARVGVLFGGVEGFVDVAGLGKFFLPKVVDTTAGAPSS